MRKSFGHTVFSFREEKKNISSQIFNCGVICLITTSHFAVLYFLMEPIATQITQTSVHTLRADKLK